MESLARIRVAAGEHHRKGCPVSTRVDGVVQAVGQAAGPGVLGRLCLRDLSSNREIPLQAWTLDGRSAELAWVVDGLPAGGEAVYDLGPRDSDADPPVGVELERTGTDEIHVSVTGRPFTTYHYGSDVVRPYLYPVLADGRTGVTRDWPMTEGGEGETSDHPHHKGIWTALGEVNGTDNWSESPGHGYQIHAGFTECYSGRVAGGFVEKLVWTDGDRRPNLCETRQLRFTATDGAIRLMDYDVTLAADHGEVVLGDTKEAGLISVRVASSMDAARENGGRIICGAGGRGEAETWGRRARWCDYSGPIHGEWWGICVMDHPGNPRHPTHWHVRDYGLMTANCFGIHDFTADPANLHPLRIPEGETRTWRYRVYLHAGEGQATDLDARYADYADPPEVRVISEITA